MVYFLLRCVRWAPTFCQVKDLMKIHNRGKFHQFVVAKLKFFKVLHIDSAYVKRPFLWVFWPLLNFAKSFTRGSTQANKNIVWKFFEKFKLLWKRKQPKVWTFGLILSHVSPWKWNLKPPLIYIKKVFLLRLHSSTFVYTCLVTRLHPSTLI